MKPPSRIVYSTQSGRMCPACGQPADRCTCRTAPHDAPVPGRVVAKLRLEKAGRGGKSVTVVYDLPRNDVFLKALCQDLKRACSVGGTVSGNTIELQGDVRARVGDLLRARGYGVKGLDPPR